MVQAPLSLSPGAAPASREGRRAIKLVTYVLRPEKLDAVLSALHQLDLAGGITVVDVRGFGRQKGLEGHFMGGAYTIRFIPKARVDLAVPEESVPAVMDAVRRAAHTGHIGDGKVFVVDVSAAQRIRTKEGGIDAL